MIYFVLRHNTCDSQYAYNICYKTLSYKAMMHVYISFIQSTIDVIADTVENEHLLREEECDDEKGKI